MAVGMVVEQARRRARPRARSRGRRSSRASTSRAVEAGIAVGVEQALLGGEHGARCRRRRSRRPRGSSRPWRRAGRRPSAEPLADVVVAGQVIFAAPAVEAEARAAAARCRCRRTIGPVSRSQMSPNGSTITLAKGASRARLGGGVFVGGDQPDLLALAVGVDRGGEGRDLGLRRARDRPPTARRRSESRSTPLRAAPIREGEAGSLARA